ncbi:hypothetical protein ACS0TY_014162 [Phlomoides rotata]
MKNVKSNRVFLHKSATNFKSKVLNVFFITIWKNVKSNRDFLHKSATNFKSKVLNVFFITIWFSYLSY